MISSFNAAVKIGLLLTFALAAIALGLFTPGQQINSVNSAVDGAAMSIAIDPADTIICPDTKVLSEVCVPLGATFDVIAYADAVPLSGSPPGYIAAQAWLHFGTTGILLIASTTLWPDCDAAYLDLVPPGMPDAHRGCLTGLISPPISVHKGSLFSFTFTCTPTPSSHQIELETLGGPNAGTNGTSFAPADGGGLIAVPGSTLLVNCTAIPAKQPFPGDTDGDGCPDVRENGTDETLGGQRDYLNPWDFYDVETISGPGQDGVVDMLFDILSVINHYSPTGMAPYDAHYDRGPSAGPNAWNMTAPDGVIDLLNDILGVVLQGNHTCT